MHPSVAPVSFIVRKLQWTCFPFRFRIKAIQAILKWENDFNFI